MPEPSSAAGVPSVDTPGSTIQIQLMLYYQSIAYTLVFIAYIFSFGEYLFLRLTYLLNPENIIQHSGCHKGNSSDIIGKTALNYGAVIIAFIFVAVFQIMCFFGLTISEKWIRYRIGNASDPMVRLRKLLSQQIRTVMQSTVYPTFICYGLASVSVWLIIFYMVGIRDSIDELAFTISLYIFDGVLLIYFFAFPIITYIYHPYVRKSAALTMLYATGVRNLRNPSQFTRQILSSETSSDFRPSNQESAPPKRYSPWLRPTKSIRSFSGRIYTEYPTAISLDNPTAIQTNPIPIPNTFHRNGRLTSTV